MSQFMLLKYITFFSMTFVILCSSGSFAQESTDALAPVVIEQEAGLAVAADPKKGAVTNLPIPRFVTLKGSEGNARRGPGLTHRIDWVFTTAGTPLRVTAEHENWRRVEDAEGMGGWVHYSLLSGSRSILVTRQMTDFHDAPDASAMIMFQAERGVIGKLLGCELQWCRVNIQGEKGWALKSSIWGVGPDEILN
jgi:SH3-like domain-containing protein